MDPSTSFRPSTTTSSALGSTDQQCSTAYLRVPISQASSSVGSPQRSVSSPRTVMSESGDSPFPPRQRRSILRSWSWEIGLLIFSVTLLVSVFVILTQQNGKPSQGWTLPQSLESLNLALLRDLSLNTLVATLSTFLRASMVAIAASIISQRKWVWYWDRTIPARPLRNLQDFEDASRGIWGSLRLLPIVLRHSASALVAALIIILSFAIGPFVQQSVRTVIREVAVEDQVSSLPVTYSMNLTSDYYFRTLDQPMFSMYALNSRVKGLIFSTLGNPSTIASMISADCSTGNCDFPSWGNWTPTSSGRFINAASVGVCNSCLDATTLTTTMQNDAYPDSNYVKTYLPNGMNISQYWDDGPGAIAFTSGELSWAAQLYDQETSALSRWAFVNVTVLSYTLEKLDTVSRLQQGAVSMVCSLYPCLQAYSASVRGGKLDETVLQSTPLYPDVGNFSGNGSDAEIYWHERLLTFTGSKLKLAAVQEPCRVEDTIYSGSNISQLDGSNSTMIRLLDPNAAPDYPARAIPRRCLFQVEASFSMLLRSFLTDQIFANSACSWHPRQGVSIQCKEKWWLGQFWEEGNATTDTIKTRFGAFADSLTAQIRLGFGREPGSTDHVTGTTLQTVSFTVISWPWLIFPTVMLLVEALVLLGMIVGTWRGREDEMVWKSNLLPFVFHHDRFVFEGGEETVFANNGSKGTHGPLQTAQEMEKEAKQIKTKFIRHGVDEWGQQSGGKAWNHRLRKPTRIQDSDLDSLLMDEDMELRPLPQQTVGQFQPSN